MIGDRASGPFSVYMPYKDFDRIQLSDGDKVLFNDDMHAQVYDVQVMGSYRGPSYFTVRKETRLHDLLNHIPIDPNMADYGSIYIMRKSVAARQKEMLEDSSTAWSAASLPHLPALTARPPFAPKRPNW